MSIPVLQELTLFIACFEIEMAVVSHAYHVGLYYDAPHLQFYVFIRYYYFFKFDLVCVCPQCPLLNESVKKNKKQKNNDNTLPDLTLKQFNLKCGITLFDILWRTGWFVSPSHHSLVSQHHLIHPPGVVSPWFPPDPQGLLVRASV